MKTKLYILLFLSCLGQTSFGQLTANAGSPRFLCVGTSTTLGGAPTASGGTPPYTYLWQPSTFLSSTTVPNPIAISCKADVLYILKVIDAAGDTAYSYTNRSINKIYTFNAGIDTGYCIGQQGGITIGALNNNNAFHTFSWTPTIGLDNPSSPNPIASPSVTTIYVLTVSDGICPNNISQITVTPFSPPIVDAGLDTTIDEGQTITLHGIGSVKYWWQPDYNIKYLLTPNPDVWPTANTTYTLYTENQHKCSASDTVRVNIKNGDILFFYSAFSPNFDGDNDYFYIGNIEKYPENKLKIFNRYGKLIYNATGYKNDWDAKYLGQEVPTGTYFYILDDGKDKKYNGSVTILR